LLPFTPFLLKLPPLWPIICRETYMTDIDMKSAALQLAMLHNHLEAELAPFYETLGLLSGLLSGGAK
jgi:hypothetical protein